MEDPVEIQRRIERLAKRVRRRDDYGKLLATGQAIRPGSTFGNRMQA